MAGEAILKIKEKEKEASQIINMVKEQALKVILSAKEKKSDFIQEKDKLLEKEEVIIKEKYDKAMKEILQKLEEEELSDIEKINSLCKQNLAKATRFISDEIVRE